MYRNVISIVLAILAGLPLAAQTAADGEKILQQMVPQCYDSKLKRSGYPGKLPSGFTGEQVTLESDDPFCHFDGALLRIPDGRWYVGTPWPIGGSKGTPSEKLKRFAWERMKASFVPEAVEKDGALEKLVVRNVTEAGKVSMEGYVDAAGTIFMMGDVAATTAELMKKRDARLAPLLAKAPSRGPKDAPIQIIEFSDFQCPGCKQAHGYVPEFLGALDGRVRYTRIDLPLVSSHPWAFAAAAIGRAIHRQKPDVFWAWKDAVYANQADLNPFTIDQFGRNFAEDHGLDMKRYDADVVSSDLHDEILAGVGQAYTIQINATPSFIVNGKRVSPGIDGKNLQRYLTELAAETK